MTGRPVVSVVLIATGPERILGSAVDTLARQTAIALEVVAVCERGREEFVAQQLRSRAPRHRALTIAPSGTPGAIRNAAVEVSAGTRLAVLDGGELLPPDYLNTAVTALDGAPSAAFVAAPGDLTPARPATQLDVALLVAGPWSVAAPVISRDAFDRAGGFDESLPDLVLWDLLLRLAQLGETGILLTDTLVSRSGSDDVRLRESLRPERHLPAVRRIFVKHRPAFETHAASILVDRERIARRLWSAERALLDRRERLQAELADVMRELAAVEGELRTHGRSTLEWTDLRRTTPLSRNWGLDRGRPIDRHYIEGFVAEHAGDVRGDVLEMLDSALTTAHGGARVRRADVLDIDPANDRASIVADLRAADHVPSNSYDCFILTQTLHLIDDMPAALAHAHRILRPGGVLLATLPCVSMVADEYGAGGDHWRVTESGARRLFERYFAPADLIVVARGNVLASAAFLYGLACHELEPHELHADDPAYPLIVCVRAVKASGRRGEDRARTQPARASKDGLAAPRAAVLLYHRVSTISQHDRHRMAVTACDLRRHVEYLCREWRPIPLTALAAAACAGDPPDRAIALTFDDGYLDNLLEATPILTEFGVPATFFVTSEPLARQHRFWWDLLEELLLPERVLPQSIQLEVDGVVRSFNTADEAARATLHDEVYAVLKGSLPAVRDDVLWQLERNAGSRTVRTGARPMIADEVRALARMPGVEIGAHSVHHVGLAGLDPEQLFREVSECRTSLERALRQDVTMFAYPFGELSNESVAAVRAAGYRFAFTCDPRGLRSRDHALRLPRIQAPGDPAALERRLTAI